MKTVVVELSRDQFNRKLREIKRGRLFKLTYYHMGNKTVESRLAQYRIPQERKDPTRKVPEGILYYHDIKRDGIRGPREENVIAFKYGGIQYKHLN
mgnify:CR=1 FL=1